MYLDAKISKKEMDHLLRADALFRFEETHNSPPPTPPTPARAAAADATAGADIEPIFRGGPPPPPQALSRHRFTDSSTTLSKKKIQQAHNSAKRRLHVQQTRDRWRQNERDLQVANDTKAWERIFAHPQNWEDAKRRGVVTQLCFRGVPPAVRRRAWCAMIGNPLMITRELYEINSQRAQELSWQQRMVSEAENKRFGSQGGPPPPSSQPDSFGSPAAAGKEETMQLLDQDLPRTLPQYQFLQTSGSLRDVLQTFVRYRPDIGYVQGMSYLAATLLLYMDDSFECFTCFANLLNQPFCFDIYRLQREQLDLHIKTFEYFFKLNLPALYQLFKRYDVEPMIYYLDWALTLYVKCLPLDVVARVWDSYLLLGEAFCIRTALGILKLFGKTLSRMDSEEIARFLQHLPQDLNQQELFSQIEEIRITPEECSQVVSRLSNSDGATRRRGFLSFLYS